MVREATGFGKLAKPLNTIMPAAFKECGSRPNFRNRHPPHTYPTRLIKSRCDYFGCAENAHELISFALGAGRSARDPAETISTLLCLHRVLCRDLHSSHGERWSHACRLLRRKSSPVCTPSACHESVPAGRWTQGDHCSRSHLSSSRTKFWKSIPK